MNHLREMSENAAPFMVEQVQYGGNAPPSICGEIVERFSQGFIHVEHFKLPVADGHVAVCRYYSAQSNSAIPMVFLGIRTFSSPIWTDIRLGGTVLAELIVDLGFDAYFVDTRGFGRASMASEMYASKAEEVRERYSISDMESDTETALRFVVQRVGHAVPVVSYSFTVIPLMRLMARCPELISAGLMIAANWQGQKQKNNPWLIGEIARLEAMASFRFTMEAVVARILRGNQTGQKMLYEEFQQACDTALRIAQPHTYCPEDQSWLSPVGHILEDYRNLLCGKASFAPEEVRAPVLLAASRDDIESPPHMSQEIAALLPGKKEILTFEGGSHFWIFERERENILRNLLDSFLRFMQSV